MYGESIFALVWEYLLLGIQIPVFRVFKETKCVVDP